ncbi:hypothetical protein AB7C87_00270 [Natrarchaeobius sp. A-rgal3]
MIEVDEHAEKRSVDDDGEGWNGVTEEGKRREDVDENARDDERDRRVVCRVDR